MHLLQGIYLSVTSLRPVRMDEAMLQSIVTFLILHSIVCSWFCHINVFTKGIYSPQGNPVQSTSQGNFFVSLYSYAYVFSCGAGLILHLPIISGALLMFLNARIQYVPR